MADGAAHRLGIGRAMLPLFAVDDAPGRLGAPVIAATIHRSVRLQLGEPGL
jgi:hypothetical protein